MAFKKFSQLKTKHQILLTGVIVIAVISIWRGFWGLCDEYLFPANYKLSLWVSLIFGFIILISAHYPLRDIVKELV